MIDALLTLPLNPVGIAGRKLADFLTVCKEINSTDKNELVSFMVEYYCTRLHTGVIADLRHWHADACGFPEEDDEEVPEAESASTSGC